MGFLFCGTHCSAFFWRYLGKIMYVLYIMIVYELYIVAVS